MRDASVSMIEDGPAAEAGFEKDDVVMSFNETRVDSARQFKRMVSEMPPGRKVRLEVFRDGDLTTLEPVLGERPQGLSSGGY